MKIAVIGLGNMGGPMAGNLVRAGHVVTGFDLAEASLLALTQAGGMGAVSIADAVGDAELVLTMLPAGRHVEDVLQAVLPALAAGALLIDSSTIDVETARRVAAKAADAGFDMLDAPVSGGVGGAVAGTLTFMVGGSEAGFAAALPVVRGRDRPRKSATT
jgi:3-hydroxyisobutyrate dehydrogenase